MDDLSVRIAGLNLDGSGRFHTLKGAFLSIQGDNGHKRPQPGSFLLSESVDIPRISGNEVVGKFSHGQLLLFVFCRLKFQSLRDYLFMIARPLPDRIESAAADTYQ
jgi:hypothetical protein